MSMGAAGRGAGGGEGTAPKKSGLLKWVLILGVGFFVLCIGSCAGLFALGLLMPDGPSDAALAQMPESNKSIDDLIAALPSLKDGTSTRVVKGARENRHYTSTVGGGTIELSAYAWNGTVRQVEVQVRAPAGDVVSRPTGQMLMWGVMAVIEPTYTEAHTDEYNTFAAGDSGSRDFDAMHVQVEVDSHAGDSQTTYRLNMRKMPTAAAGAAGTGPSKTPGPVSTGGSGASVPTGPFFAVTVALLEEALPLLKEAGHSDATDNGLPYRTWSKMALAGQEHTVTAYGPDGHLSKMVVQTHIAKSEDKLTKMSGMVLTFSLMQKLDPTIDGGKLEGFVKWSYAAMGRDSYGNVQVVVRSTGDDEVGQKIEYTLTPLK